MASLLALCVLLLIVGTSVSSYLAVQYRDKEIEANRRANDLSIEKRRAQQAKEEAESAYKLLIPSLLRPFRNSSVAVTPSEMKTLRVIRQLPNDDLRQHLFSQVLKESEQDREIEAGRLVLITHASVGLNLESRARLLKVVSPIVFDRKAKRSVRLACARVGIALRHKNDRFLRESRELIVESCRTARDVRKLQAGVKALTILAFLMTRNDATQYFQETLTCIESSPSSRLVHAWLNVLEVLAHKLSASSVEQLAKQMKSIIYG